MFGYHGEPSVIVGCVVLGMFIGVVLVALLT